MKYRDLNIQTQREFPNNARIQGFGLLVRAGYMTREGRILPLGEKVPSLLHASIPVIANDRETFFPLAAGSTNVIHCPSCKYVERKELAKFKKTPFSNDAPLPLEKVRTPDCHTIEALANFLNIPKEQTAKALMYARVADNRFIFAVVRGDMNLSEAKLRNAIGEFRLAKYDDIEQAGAAAGYASPIGLKDALIIVDDLIPQSPNLAAGANEEGYHLKNTNYGRDYSAEVVADLVQADAGDACVNCGSALEIVSTIPLMSDAKIQFENLLLALAETHHDDKGLTLPVSAAPFDIYLMQVPGRTMDTRAKAEEIYNKLQGANLKVLFDDRDERAGVKFNDADLIGCPIRITVGERGLAENKVELKLRTSSDVEMLALDELVRRLKGGRADTDGLKEGSDAQDVNATPPEKSQNAKQESVPLNVVLIMQGVKAIPLNKPSMTVGRSLDNSIVIDDPRVSRQHAEIRVENGGFVLHDLNSSGGTYVNGRRITQVMLYVGDMVSLAGVNFVFTKDTRFSGEGGNNSAPEGDVSVRHPTAIFNRSVTDDKNK